MAGGKKGGKDKGKTRARRPVHGVKRADTYGAKTINTLSRISQTKQDEEVKRSLELGLEAASSIVDRNISLFSRGHQPAFAGINTFMKAPYCEDIRKVGDFEAAFVGAPFDSATTYRPARASARRRSGASPRSMTDIGSTAASISTRSSISATPATSSSSPAISRRPSTR